MAQIDTISKYLIKNYPGDFVRFTLGRDDVDVLQVLDSEQPTVKAHFADSLLRVRLGSEEVLVHTEFQTTDSSPPMPQRMTGYIGRAFGEYGLPVYSSVIYLRPEAGRRDPGYCLQDRPGHRFLVEYRVIRLIEQAGKPILESGPVGLIPFAPLMSPPPELAGDAWLRQCLQAGIEQPMERSVRADYLAGMSMLSELVYAPETISEIISKEGIVMDIMRESSLAQLFTREGRQEGRQEGIKQGREEGGRERAIEDLLDVLKIRFSLDAADPLAAGLAAIGDLQRLRRLHRAAIQADSLEEFRHLAEGGE